MRWWLVRTRLCIFKIIVIVVAEMIEDRHTKKPIPSMHETNGIVIVDVVEWQKTREWRHAWVVWIVPLGDIVLLCKSWRLHFILINKRANTKRGDGIVCHVFKLIGSIAP